MAYSQNFFDGVSKIGLGLGGLAGAYSFASSWGSFASVGGLFAGTLGIFVGGIVGSIAGSFVLTVAVSVIFSVLDLLTTFVCLALLGTGKVLGLA